MRLVALTLGGRRQVGDLHGDQVVPLLGIDELGPAADSDVVAAAPHGEPIPVSEVVLLPVVAPRKIFCVGLNYASHIAETKRDDSAYPVLFPKWESSLIPPDGDIVLPPETAQFDYEAELAVVIGRRGRRIAPEDAADHVLGYALANDVTVRDYQYLTHQWLQGKAWDSTTPIGPVVTADEWTPSAQEITLDLNGERLQSATLDLMIFSVSTLVAVISEFTELLPGDVILTGTPGGVGFRRDPQVFMHDGDVVTVSIEGLGELTNRVVAE